jgi:ActR/RegA family two-component response regulator
MHAPQVIVLEPDGWIVRNLADVAAEDAWIVRGTRGVDSALALVRAARPCVLIVQVELAEDKPASLRLIADLRRERPDVPVVAVSDVKMNDADRVAWAAALFDLGARYTLFPPLTKPVLEDVVSGLMAATIRRTLGAAPVAGPDAPKAAKPKPRRAKPEAVIDLADEDMHE